MPQIDLARATVRVLDGYRKTGAINNVAGEALGATSLTVDGFSAAIPNGVRLQIAGDDNIYTVTATTGGATPTAITITPGLLASCVDNAVVTVGPNFVEVVMAEGNLTYEEKQKFEYVRNKRKISFVKTGDEDPTDVSLDAIWEYLSSASAQPPTIEEAFKQEGNASTWITSGSDPCEPYCIDLEVTYTPPCVVSDSQERVTLKELRVETFGHNLKDGMLNFKGMCKVTRAVKERF